MEAIRHAEKTMQNQMKKHVFKNCLQHILFRNLTHFYIPFYSMSLKLRDILQVTKYAVTVVPGGYTFYHVFNIRL
jgi:hypothetical protein